MANRARHLIPPALITSLNCTVFIFSPSELRHGARPGGGGGGRVDVVGEDRGRGLGGAGPGVRDRVRA